MEDVIVESIQIMGQNCYYIPREAYDQRDLIFGESTKVVFNKAYQIEAYVANVEGFEGDGDFFSKFGLEIRDSSNFIISRRSFDRFVPSSLRIRPQEGDLIWVPFLHRMFEIKFIEKKLMFYSLGNRHPFIYELRCEDFRYSEEKIETGIEEIDTVEEENAYTVKALLSPPGSGDFQQGETVYQSPDGTWANNTAYAEVGEWFKANGVMYLFGITGSFSNNAVLHGNTTHAVHNAVTFIKTGDFIKYDFNDNETFNTDTTLILDLSELNPFGTP